MSHANSHGHNLRAGLAVRVLRERATRDCDLLLCSWKIRCLSTGCVLPLEELIKAFSSWLGTEEPPGRNENGTRDLAFLFQAFRSSVIQRGFLRHAQKHHGVVIAGSYPACLHLQRKNGSTLWNPNDIDVWVFDISTFDIVEECYRKWLTAFGASPQCDSVQDEYRSDDSDEESRSTQQQLRNTSPESLREEVIKWLDDQRESWEDDELRNEMCRLTNVNGHVLGRKRDYSIVSVARLQSNGDHWKDINLICVSMRTALDCPCNGIRICSSFDLSCCCVEMHVSEDLIASLTFHCDAQNDLNSFKMRLMPCSFSATLGCVCPQMLRIAKYTRRGFRFREDE